MLTHVFGMDLWREGQLNFVAVIVLNDFKQINVNVILFNIF